jgi:hypothetical protein
MHSSLASLALLVITSRGPAAVVPSGLIVGRANCGDSVLLLTEKAEVVQIAIRGGAATVRQVSGLAGAGGVWGLACLSDGTLWTLADARTTARIDRRTWQIAERVPVQLPRVGLFAAGDRLLVQQFPIAAGAPALVTVRPRQPQNVKPWPGLIARLDGARQQQIARNLATCGLGVESVLPCWFASSETVVISDGTVARSHDLKSLLVGAIDRSAPIRDVALIDVRGTGAPGVEGPAYWLLATTTSDNRRAGGRLIRAREPARDSLSIDITPPARLILSATERTCVLLTVDGGVMEVAVQ